MFNNLLLLLLNQLFKKSKHQQKSKTTTPTVTGKGNHVSTSVSHINNYKKSMKTVVKRGEGSVDLVATKSFVQIDFDQLNFDMSSDKPRQAITKKENCPRDMVFVIVNLERIDFSKDKEESKIETVLTIRPIADFSEGGGMKRIVEGVEVDYNNIKSKIHPPKRFQSLFKSIELLRFVGSLYISPKCDEEKWKDKTDTKRSSLPVFILIKSRATLESIGVELDNYPTIDDFLNQYVFKTEEVSEPAEKIMNFLKK